MQQITENCYSFVWYPLKNVTKPLNIADEIFNCTLTLFSLCVVNLLRPSQMRTISPMNVHLEIIEAKIQCVHLFSAVRIAVSGDFKVFSSGRNHDSSDNTDFQHPHVDTSDCRRINHTQTRRVHHPYNGQKNICLLYKWKRNRIMFIRHCNAVCSITTI